MRKLKTSNNWEIIIIGSSFLSIIKIYWSVKLVKKYSYGRKFIYMYKYLCLAVTIVQRFNHIVRKKFKYLLFPLATL